MKEQTAATKTGSNKAISKGSRGNKARKESRANKDLKEVDNRAVNSKAVSNPAARKMVAVSPTATGSAWGRTAMPSWAEEMVAATPGSFPLRYVSGFVKLRTCDASGG